MVGKIIKEVRLSKNIKSKDLYQDLLSRPAVSKFESGDSDTSVEKFLVILDRLNVSLEEFSLLYKKEENYLDMTKNYIIAFYNKDIDKLKYLIDDGETKYKKYQNIKYLHMQSISKLLLADILGEKESNNEVNILKNYLSVTETWGYYELVLFTNTLTFYSEDFIDQVYKKSRNRLLKLDKLMHYRNETFILLLNILEKYIMANNKDKINFYYRELVSLKKYTKDNMYCGIMLIFFGEIVKIINGKSKDIVTLKKIKDHYNLIDMSFKAEQCEKIISHVLATNKISIRNGGFRD